MLNVGRMLSTDTTWDIAQSSSCLRLCSLFSRKFCSLFCSLMYTFFVLFLGLMPIFACSGTASTCSHSACNHSVTFHTDGWSCPTRLEELVSPFRYVSYWSLVGHRWSSDACSTAHGKQRWHTANSATTRRFALGLRFLSFSWLDTCFNVPYQFVGWFRHIGHDRRNGGTRCTGTTAFGLGVPYPLFRNKMEELLSTAINCEYLITINLFSAALVLDGRAHNDPRPHSPSFDTWAFSSPIGTPTF